MFSPMNEAHLNLDKWTSAIVFIKLRPCFTIDSFSYACTFFYSLSMYVCRHKWLDWKSHLCTLALFVSPPSYVGPRMAKPVKPVERFAPAGAAGEKKRGSELNYYWLTHSVFIRGELFWKETRISPSAAAHYVVSDKVFFFSFFSLSITFFSS